MSQTLSKSGAFPPTLEAINISKRFGGAQALKEVSLSLYPGEILGLLGPNGAGKSTLIRILTGDLQPDSGVLKLAGVPTILSSVGNALQQGIGVVRQELALVPQLSLAENIFLGQEASFTKMGFLNRKALKLAAQPLLARVGLELNPGSRLSALSIGDRQLVAASRALRTAARVLLLDEPTSSLTPWEAERLFTQVETLAASGIAIVYISHRIEEVARLCHRVVMLRDGATVAEFDTPGKHIPEIISTLAPGETTVEIQEDRRVGQLLLQAKNLKLGRHGPASFQLHAGEIVGFFGLVGAGRTTLARILTGDLIAESGELVLNGKALTLKSPFEGYRHGIAYLSENRTAESIFPGLNLRDNIGVRVPGNTNRAGWLNKTRLRELAVFMTGRLNIRPPHQKLAIEAFSGGNQQKAVLARLLAEALDILVLDEPTHGIDVGAKRDLHKLLKELAGQGKAIAYISSELAELMTIADRVLVVRGGQIVGEFNPKVDLERDLVGAAVGAGVKTGQASQEKRNN